MARNTFSFEKRRKELEKKQKQEAKKQRKLENASRPADDDPEGTKASDETPTTTPEGPGEGAVGDGD